MRTCGELTIEQARVKLRREFVTALDTIAERTNAIGNLDVAARSLALTVEENPRSDEDRTRRLLQIYQRLGKPDLARAAFETYRRKGGSPSVELTRLLHTTEVMPDANEACCIEPVSV